MPSYQHFINGKFLVDSFWSMIYKNISYKELEPVFVSNISTSIFLIVLVRIFKTILHYYGDTNQHYYISHFKANASYSSQINYIWLILLCVEIRTILALNLPCVRQVVGPSPYNDVNCTSIFLIKNLLQNNKEVENVGIM